MTPEQHDRMCPSCRARHRVPPTRMPTQFDVVPLDQEGWYTLRRAAEAFDRAASTEPSEEYTCGCGDGETLFSAATFVEWIKPDCAGYRDLNRPEADGAPPVNERSQVGPRGTRHRHPDPLPYYKRPTRRAS